MDRKFMKQLLIGMKIFFILIFPWSENYQPSLYHFPSLFCSNFKPSLLISQNMILLIANFMLVLKRNLDFVRTEKNRRILDFGFWILHISEHCLINQRHLNDPYYRATKYFLNFCLGNKSKHPLHLGLCLLKCYKNHPKRHF